MPRKTSQNKLSQRKRLFAKLRYEDKLKDAEIAKQCGISRRVVYDWDKDPLVQKEMTRLGEADTRKSQRILEQGSVRAAKVLVLITDTEKDEAGKVRLKYGEETVRKAAGDILHGAGINIKGPGETGGAPSAVHIYLPENKRDRKHKGQKQ